MEKFIKFDRVTTSEGRNGCFKTTGVSVWLWEHKDEKLNAIQLSGITSRGVRGRGSIEIPMGQAAIDLANAILEINAAQEICK